jgi:hypothetical protein
MSEYKPGDIIKITVGGIEYDTVIDQHNVQRFIENPDHFLVKQIPMIWDTYLKRNIENMNEMRRRYIQGEFSQRDYAEMNMAVGYSVCGFADLSPFEDMEIINPVWEN